MARQRIKEGPLWQISVTIPREAEEATAALLERVFGEIASIYAPESEVQSVATVYSYRRVESIQAQRKALMAGLRLIADCGLEIGRPKVRIQKVPREDWTTSWKKYFKTIEIGHALLIRPSWSKRRLRPGQALVTLDPGLSFGTGQHATTAFCLEALVGARKTGHPESFLDIGTGSGILAIAAVKLGYAPVRAFDNDALAVRVATANARKNRVEGRLELRKADLTKLPVRPVRGRRYTLICANLVQDLLLSESQRISNWVEKGGQLVLAGLLWHQFQAVADVYCQRGFRLERAQRQGEWKSGAFTKV